MKLSLPINPLDWLTLILVVKQPRFKIDQNWFFVPRWWEQQKDCHRTEQISVSTDVTLMSRWVCKAACRCNSNCKHANGSIIAHTILGFPTVGSWASANVSGHWDQLICCDCWVSLPCSIALFEKFWLSYLTGLIVSSLVQEMFSLFFFIVYINQLKEACTCKSILPQGWASCVDWCFFCTAIWGFP